MFTVPIHPEGPAMARDDDDVDDRDDEDDDRPRRRKRRRDDDDDYEFDRKKRRGGGDGGGGSKVLIILLVVGFVLLLFCGVGGYLLLTGVSKVRGAAARATEQNNIKQITLGMHNSMDRNNGRPIPADGNLSWRVHMLPYIEQDMLYRQFEINRPWNQGRNAQLGETAIRTYQSPLDEAPAPSQTHYRVFVGDGSSFDSTLWEKDRFPNFIKDGTSNTIMVIDTAETVPWAQPKEVILQKGGQFPEFGHPKRDQVLMGMWDGSIRTTEKKALDAAKVRAMATAAGGEAIGDW
jgi:hypothetical protein